MGPFSDLTLATYLCPICPFCYLGLLTGFDLDLLSDGRKGEAPATLAWLVVGQSRI